MSVKKIIKNILSFLLYGNPPRITANVVTMASSELLKGRCALITGGTSGIGYSIAKAFLNAGANVIITGRSQERLDKACTSLGCQGRVYSFVMDNTKVNTFEPTFKEMLSSINGEGKKIDILVNNAGVLGASLPNATEEAYDAVLDTNLKGVFFLSQMVGKYMKSNGIKGNILNVASSSSLRPAASAYTISKWGIRGLTLGLAKSLAPLGITVNGVAPGPTATPMLMKEDETNLYNKIPLGRYVLPDEIANMAVFLVSEMGRSVIGDIVYMTGGAGVIGFDDMKYNF